MSERAVPAGAKPRSFAALRVKGARTYLLDTALFMLAALWCVPLTLRGALAVPAAEPLETAYRSRSDG